jgi:hypothetical protein
MPYIFGKLKTLAIKIKNKLDQVLFNDHKNLRD